MTAEEQSSRAGFQASGSQAGWLALAGRWELAAGWVWSSSGSWQVSSPSGQAALTQTEGGEGVEEFM